MFDQFTGATITPRAVVKAVKHTVVYFTENKTSLLTRPNACAKDAIIEEQASDVSDQSLQEG